MKLKTAAIAAFLVMLASAAWATNLGLTAGILLPLGDFSDHADTSPYVGAHWEIQDVNARGQVALMSFVFQGGFAFLQTDGSFEKALDALGESGDGRYFDLGVGVRVHSAALPLFVTAGAHYVNLNPAGNAGAINGVGATVGLGLQKGTPQLKLGVEARVNVAALEDDVNLQHFLLLATIGLPF